MAGTLGSAFNRSISFSSLSISAVPTRRKSSFSAFSFEISSLSCCHRANMSAVRLEWYGCHPRHSVAVPHHTPQFVVLDLELFDPGMRLVVSLEHLFYLVRVVGVVGGLALHIGQFPPQISVFLPRAVAPVCAQGGNVALRCESCPSVIYWARGVRKTRVICCAPKA